MNEDSNIIWRYIDFTKFVSLLDRSALFFARADKFKDQFEGSWTKNNFERMTTALKNVDVLGADYTREFFKKLREYTYINCWHLSAEESAALWKLYLKSDEGIAIRSTLLHLKSELGRNCRKNDLYIRKVKYINHKTYDMPEGNMLAPFIHKRTSFTHEKEVRAIIQPLKEIGEIMQQLPIKNGIIDQSSKSPEDGIYINVDPNIIIDMIYISPDAQQWFKELVESILEKYGLSKVVKRSSLSDDPIF